MTTNWEELVKAIANDERWREIHIVFKDKTIKITRKDLETLKNGIHAALQILKDAKKP